MVRYCVNYTRNFRHYDTVDEVILNYKSGSESIVEFLNNFIKDKNQRIILDISEIETEDRDIQKTIPIISKLKKDGFNIAVKVTRDQDINLLKNNNIPFFFTHYANSMEQAYIQAEAGASDVYVAEELGFRIKDLQKLKEKYGIKLRVLPNIAQVSKGGKGYVSPLEQFWIRPEDTEIYEPYIDVFEIWGINRLSIVYEIYKQQQWLGELEDIILDFGDVHIPNTGINPHFAEMRLNCGKRCLLGQCNLCQQIGILADKFNEVGLRAIKPRIKPEVSEERKQEILEKIEQLNESRTNQNTDNDE